MNKIMNAPNPPDIMMQAGPSVSGDTSTIRKPPITLDTDGVYRVGATRVRLETVITAFQWGCTAEEILQKYPSLELAEIYSTITFYLENREFVDAYMESRRRQRDEVSQELESRFPSAGVRERLLARRSAQS
jgi:uncharacterized protein (DUF433 family)